MQSQTREQQKTACPSSKAQSSESTFCTLTAQFAHCVISHRSATVDKNRTTISLTSFNFVPHLLCSEVPSLSTASPDAALSRY